MGCFPKPSSCDCDLPLRKKIFDILGVPPELKAAPLPNPDPANFVIKDIVEVGSYLVARIHYPDCKNYEGNKIMVYENTTKEQLKSVERLDPHFCERLGCISPVARFVPTEQGWDAAKIFAELMENLQTA